MATILFVSTFGSDDPTRASLPLVAAGGAIEAGHTPQLFLAGEATYLMKDVVAEQVQGIGWPPFKDLLQRLVSNGVPIFV